VQPAATAHVLRWQQRLAWTYDSQTDRLSWEGDLRELLNIPWPPHLRGLPDQQLVRQLLDPVLTACRTLPEGGPIQVQLRVPADTGDRVLEVTVERDPDRPHHWAGQVEDVTQALQAGDAAQELRQRYRALVELSPDCILVHQDGRLVYANSCAQQVAGVPDASHLLGTPIHQYVVRPADREQMLANIRSMSRVGEYTHHGDMWVVTPTGRRVLMDCTSIFVLWNGRPAYQLILRDVTQARRDQRRQQRLATHDPSSGLRNRSWFLQALGGPRRADSQAVLHLQLQNLPQIQDLFGYDWGPRALRGAALRVKKHLGSRALIAQGDSLSLLVAQRTATRAQALELGRALQQLLQQPWVGLEEELIPECRVGVAHQAAVTDPLQLVQEADMALRQAQRPDSPPVVLYDERMREASLAHLQLVRDLHQAVLDRQLQVFFQPILATEHGGVAVLGMEALVRWRRPEGFVPPPQFIAVAEQTGQIVPLGRQVLNRALQQLAAWRAQVPQLRGAYVSVNLSVKQLQQDQGLVRQVARLLRRWGLPPQALVLEITESALIQDLHSCLRRLEALRRLGVRLALDDFGTGYSSLAYLATLPLQLVKIDKAFVDRVHDSQRDRLLLQGVLRLVRPLGLAVCAEGVELAEQLAALSHLGVPAYQGYLATPPLAAPDLEMWLAGRGR